jgi:hypothetical protein
MTKNTWSEWKGKPKTFDRGLDDAGGAARVSLPDVADISAFDPDILPGLRALAKRDERRTMEKHIVVCPFCESGHSVPLDFDAIHRCNCGACYKVCGNNTLENSVSDIADELWTEEELDFIRSVPIDFCNIVIERDFDRLLDFKRAFDSDSIERFCKYDMDINLNLVWVKRLF